MRRGGGREDENEMGVVMSGDVGVGVLMCWCVLRWRGMRERVVVRQKKGVGLEGDGTRFAGKGRNGSIRRSISQPNDDDNIHQGMPCFRAITWPFGNQSSPSRTPASVRKVITLGESVGKQGTRNDWLGESIARSK